MSTFLVDSFTTRSSICPVLLLIISFVTIGLANRYDIIRLRPKSDGRFGSLVFMSEVEREIIRLYLNQSHTMLEYGSGYSTLYFSEFVGSYYSIEHHRQWFSKIRSIIDRSPDAFSTIKNYTLVAVDPGYKGWPGGFSEGNREQFDRYIRAIHSFPLKKFDRVLIDGRARVDCAFEVHPFLHRDSVVFVHDYSNRPYYSNLTKEKYRIILQTFEGQSLAIFRPNL